MHYQRQKDCSGSVEFSDVQIVHKFAGRVTTNLHFKVTIFFNIKYLENGTRYMYFVYLRWKTDRKLYVMYWMMSFSMTVN